MLHGKKRAEATKEIPLEALGPDAKRCSAEGRAGDVCELEEVVTTQPQTPTPPTPPAHVGPPPAAALPPLVVDISCAFEPPTKLTKLIEGVAIAKATQIPPRTFLLAFLTGLYTGIGMTAATTISKGMPNSDPGLQKFAFGALAPVALFLVVFTGCELVTVNFAFMVPAFLNGTVRWWQVLRNYFLVYAGNFAGALLYAYLFGYLTGIYDNEPWHSGVRKTAELKVSFGFGRAFLLGMGSGWMVAVGVYLAAAGKTLACKILVSWFPIQTFMTIGYEHAVSNMFLIPLGMFYGADCSWGQFIGKNLVPVTLGNWASAMPAIGLAYWYLFDVRPGWPMCLFRPDEQQKKREERDRAQTAPAVVVRSASSAPAPEKQQQQQQQQQEPKQSYEGHRDQAAAVKSLTPSPSHMDNTDNV
eukprot:m51a1_g8444 hypothetical protein (415) ;mRNA; r:380036-381656